MASSASRHAAAARSSEPDADVCTRRTSVFFSTDYLSKKHFSFIESFMGSVMGVYMRFYGWTDGPNQIGFTIHIESRERPVVQIYSRNKLFDSRHIAAISGTPPSEKHLLISDDKQKNTKQTQSGL